MELQLEDLEADADEDDFAAEAAAEKTASVPAFERKRPARKPFPEPAARGGRRASAVRLPNLWQQPVIEAGRGRNGDA